MSHSILPFFAAYAGVRNDQNNSYTTSSCVKSSHCIIIGIIMKPGSAITSLDRWYIEHWQYYIRPIRRHKIQFFEAIVAIQYEKVCFDFNGFTVLFQRNVAFAHQQFGNETIKAFAIDNTHIFIYIKITWNKVVYLNARSGTNIPPPLLLHHNESCEYFS